METYESNIVQIQASAQQIFDKLSNLENLQPLINNLPPEATQKVKDIAVTSDTCRFSIENFGEMGFKIIEREPCKTIKFSGDATPVEVYLWIQLVEKEAYNTKMKVTLKADIPFMLKMMVGSKLKDGVNQIATVLSKIPY
jgi:carbon monoxide dehydrogenase subunit G